DTEVGRYVYPLESGGTDELAASFWTENQAVEQSFSADVELRVGYPIAEVRLPGLESATRTETVAPGHVRVRVDDAGKSLGKDLVVYYRLEKDLPGRVDVMAYRTDANTPGVFMAIVTPGIDLKPLTAGADYSLVLDVSGSMAGKIATLANGVTRTLKQMRPEDRFRIITFSDTAAEITGGWKNATPENIEKFAANVQNLQPTNGTNIYAGLEQGLDGLDADRVSTVLLVTDGVANTGIIDPQEFKKLAGKVDVRIFGFLMGNSANWPLMKTVTEASGGFYSAVSNGDDIVGQLLLAKGKIRSEALHDAELKIDGVKISDVSNQSFRKIYRGQQLILMGRYHSAGRATIKLNASLSGEDKEYKTSFDFPEVSLAHPELERIWALEQIEMIEEKLQLGEASQEEGDKAIESLGVNYQIVTDQTAMVVASDSSFLARGIQRRNQERMAVESAARSQRMAQPMQSYRQDAASPMFSGGKAPHVTSGRGGGAIDPIFVFVTLVMGLVFIVQRKERSKQ
ncbi:MAG: VWA domain-containing protein, partial [Deltaproteobacteria bacterium]|nr:VWA domain-containing protein [Deltaproteobacteria bacterium]